MINQSVSNKVHAVPNDLAEIFSFMLPISGKVVRLFV